MRYFRFNEAVISIYYARPYSHLWLFLWRSARDAFRRICRHSRVWPNGGEGMGVKNARVRKDQSTIFPRLIVARHKTRGKKTPLNHLYLPPVGSVVGQYTMYDSEVYLCDRYPRHENVSVRKWKKKQNKRSSRSDADVAVRVRTDRTKIEFDTNRAFTEIVVRSGSTRRQIGSSETTLDKKKSKNKKDNQNDKTY